MPEFVHDLLQRRRDATVAATQAPLWRAVVAMFALALVVYLPAALGAEFLDFDDPFFFGPTNPEFRAGLGAVFDPARPIANAWLPVAHASLWFDWAIAGEHPFWPHLHALLLHALTGVVVVRLLLALGASNGTAHVAGALFVVHPALAESVAWVSGRKDLLAGLCGFTMLLLTAGHCRRPGVLRALGALLLAALAMYAKATAVVLPFLALLVCVRIGGSRRRLVLPWLSFLVVVPIAWHHQTIAAAEGTLVAGSAGERLAQVPGAWWHYVATTLWPARLNVLYPEVETLAAFRAAWLPGVAAAFALLASFAVAWRWPAARLLAFGLAAFALALLPFNTAYPGSSIAAADRYLYFAMPGMALAVVEGLRLVLRRGGVPVAVALGLPLAVLAGSRAHDFGDDERLWRSSLAVDDRNAVAHLNLVYDLLQRGPAEVDAVRGHLDAAVAAARYPVHELRARQLLARIATMAADYPEAAVQARAAIAAAAAQLALETSEKRRNEARGLLLQAQLAAFEPLRAAGDEAGAAAVHEAAKALLPEHPDVVAFGLMRDVAAIAVELQRSAANGGASRLADDDPRGGAADRVLAQALARDPQHAGLLCAKAAWDRIRDRVLPALRSYRLAQAAAPEMVDAWLGAARLLRERENFTEAVAYAQKGLAQRPDPSLRQELALALVGLGQLDDAILQLEAYLKARPQDQDAAKVLANVLIGRAYGKLGEPGVPPDEVQRIVDRALAYNPKEGKAHLVLGRLRRQQRQLREAAEHLETAFRLLPDFDDSRRQLADCLADLGYERVLQRDDDGATAAWLRCLEVAPAELDVTGIRNQLAAVWRRLEARGVARAQAGDRDGAIADFRLCLRIDPDQHWPAWLLATVLQKDPATDLAVLEDLCRKAVAWQERNELDRSDQVLLLATTLVRRDRHDEAKAIAVAYLVAPSPDANPKVLAALRRLAGE